MSFSWILFCVAWNSLHPTDAANNIAFNKPTESSSIHKGQRSHNAVDGSYSTGIATADYKYFAWWRVDLQTQVTDATIVVHFRIDYKRRRPGLQFYVSMSHFNSPQSPSWSPPVQVRRVHKTRGNYTQIPDVYTVNTTGEWRYLLIYTNTWYETWRSVLDFLEIEVLACTKGFYDPNCKRRCSTRGCAASSSCPYNTGVCQNGCKNRYKGLDCTDCSSGLYGDRCDKTCSQRNCFRPTTTCIRFNYKCYGCKAGWMGDECTIVCPSGQFGKNCVKQCASRQCVVPFPTCDRFIGECPGGCPAGYKLPDCTERCQQNIHYGVNCSTNCNERKCKIAAYSCDIFTGTCTLGCQKGWKGIDCTKECDSGKYGQKCAKSCDSRHCLNPSHTCDHATGACPDGGCEAGWKGEDCAQECPGNKYGRNCEKICDARNCKQPSSTCNRTTGVCPDGCTDGWSGVDCTSQCPTGTYFSGCSKQCDERHCKLPNSSCSAADGECDTGCADGWISTDCTLRCTEGRYGPNCSYICGNCSGDVSCNHVSGMCPEGCEPGLKPGLCQDKCSNSTYGKDCKNRCGNCKRSCHEVDGHCLSGCVGDFKGDLCAEPIVKDQGTSTGLIGGLCGAFILLAIVAVVTVILWRRKRKLPSTGGKPSTMATPLDDSIYVNVMDSKDRKKHSGANRDKMKINNGKRRSDVKPQVDYKSKPKVVVKPLTSNNHVPAETPNNLEEPEGEEELFEERPGNDYYNLSDVDPIRDVTIPELADIVKTVQQRQNGFLAEYNRLPWGFAAPYDDSQKPENEGKNKFRGYYPFDQNRVRLQPIPNIPGSDYINASFIQSYNKKKMYIAAQAANKKTVGDFWRMIWEHKCNRIVMLTGLIEQTRVKCELYWPEDDTTQTDEFEIQSKFTDKRADYTVRHFAVTSKCTQERRTVVHYHYTTWPDHGVPNTLSLVKFIWDIRRTDADTDGPLLVHCSAGIGRTGTYIAVDSLYDQAREERKVDVPAYVAEMRSQRKNMIQTHEQYECVFLCLVEMTTYGDTSLSSSDFFNVYNSRGMDTEVDGRSLNQLTELALSEPRSGDPKSHTMWVDGNQEFIVKHSPSFSNSQGYLLAVVPAPPLTKLLWKLVDENEVQTVLVISPLKNDIIGPNGQRVKYGNTEVKTQKTEEVSNELSIVTLQLTETNQTSNVPKSVNLYLITGNATTETLASLITDKSQMQSFSTDFRQTVIVHSKADRQNAVLLCIMSNIVGEIRTDDRVDVIRHIRKYLQHSSDVKLTKDDAERLYRFVHQYLQKTDNTNTYANM